MEAGIADAMSDRAEIIRELGEYIGFFEFMVWGFLRSVELLMLFGDHLVNLPELFGGSLPVVALENPCRVAAVRLRKGGRMDAASGNPPIINHYVIALPIVGVHSAAAHSSLPDKSGKAGSAAVAARRAGLALKLTNAEGDCGIDCMVFFDGLSRTAASFAAMRTELADFMVANRNNPAWQDVFRSCQEAPVHDDKAPKPAKLGKVTGGMGPAPAPLAGTMISYGSSSSSSSSAYSSSASSGLPLPLSMPVAEAPHLPSVSLPPLPPPFADAPPLLPPLGSPSSSVPSSVPGPADMSSLVSAPPQSFVAWLRARPKAELDLLAKDYKSFKKSQDKWLAEHPPLRLAKHVSPKKEKKNTLVRYRLATGIAYQRWKEVEGASSSSPLKDMQCNKAWAGHS